MVLVVMHKETDTQVFPDIFIYVIFYLTSIFPVQPPTQHIQSTKMYNNDDDD